jgi:hypothetical protein
LQSPKWMEVFCCNIANISFNNVRNISMGLQRKIHDSGLKVAAMSAPAKLTWTWQECVWSHNVLSVTSKVSDHHLHHEQQGWAAMTPRWLHQPQMMGVNEYKRIYSKFWANKSFFNLHPEFLSHYQMQKGQFSHYANTLKTRFWECENQW